MPVTVEAPAHAQRLLVNDDRHLVDLTMAGHASDAAPHVGGMVEKHVVGRLVHPDPGDGLAGLEARLDHASLGLSALMVEWQFMHVWVGGIVATGDSSTPVCSKDRTDQADRHAVRERTGPVAGRVTDARVILRAVIVEAREGQEGRKEAADRGAPEPVIKISREDEGRGMNVALQERLGLFEGVDASVTPSLVSGTSEFLRRP